MMREKIDTLSRALELSENRRWSLLVAALGSALAIVASIVALGIFFGKQETRLKSVEKSAQDDRAEIRRVRQDMLSAERRDIESDAKLYKLTVEIKTNIDTIDKRVETLEGRRARWQRR